MGKKLRYHILFVIYFINLNNCLWFEACLSPNDNNIQFSGSHNGNAFTLDNCHVFEANKGDTIIVTAYRSNGKNFCFGGEFRINGFPFNIIELVENRWITNEIPNKDLKYDKSCIEVLDSSMDITIVLPSDESLIVGNDPTTRLNEYQCNTENIATSFGVDVLIPQNSKIVSTTNIEGNAIYPIDNLKIEFSLNPGHGKIFQNGNPLSNRIDNWYSSPIVYQTDPLYTGETYIETITYRVIRNDFTANSNDGIIYIYVCGKTVKVV